MQIETKKPNIELNVLRVASTLGIILYAIELPKDDPINNPVDFYIDLCVEIVFTIGFVLSVVRHHRYVLLAAFYFPLILILSASFYHHLGLASSNEVNVLAIVVIFSLSMRGWMPTIGITLLIVGISISIFLVEQEQHYLQSFTDYFTNNFMVMFISIGVIIMVSYAKNSFVKQHRAIKSVKDNLHRVTEELMTKKENLRREKEILEKLNSELELKVTERTVEIQKQDKAMSAYMNLANEDIKAPFEQCLLSVKELNYQGELKVISDKIKSSADVLKKEVEELQKRLKE